MERKIMNFGLWNKKKLLLRIITFPIKLSFQIIWGVLSSILLSIKWLKNGSQEVVYGDDFTSSLVRLIEQNEQIIKAQNQNND